MGHDRIDEFDGIGRVLPMTMFTFGIAGLSLMGVPPSGGFVAKLLLLRASVMEGQWWWAAVMLIGGLLAGGYVFMVLGKAFASAERVLKVVRAGFAQPRGRGAGTGAVRGAARPRAAAIRDTAADRPPSSTRGGFAMNSLPSPDSWLSSTPMSAPFSCLPGRRP